jgi:subtilisin family serine protease
LAGDIDASLVGRLASAADADEVPIIIQMAERIEVSTLAHGRRPARLERLVRSLRETADRSQQGVRGRLAVLGAKRMRPLWIGNALAATVRAEMVPELAAMPGVKRVTLDGEIRRSAFPSLTTTASPGRNIEAVGAPALWEMGITGEGVVVAGMDTGVDLQHPDLAGRWRGGSNSWFDPNGEYPAPYDYDGHGTGTLAVAVGGDAGGTAIGVAPGARWIAAKIFRDSDYAPESSIRLAHQWLLDPDGNPATDDAPHVLNVSWGYMAGVCYAGIGGGMLEDIQTLRAAGIAIVFAAGNEGPADNSSVSPANYPGSLSVGAVDSLRKVTLFSSRGPSSCDDGLFPRLVAPGVQILTADLTAFNLDPYVTVRGTSFAAPHVAGALALLRSAFSARDTAELEAALQFSAADLGPAGPDYSYGNGFLDIPAAYRTLLPFAVSILGHRFDTSTVGDESAPFVFTVTNRGDAPLSFDPVSFAVGSAFVLTADGCGGKILDAGQQCALAVAYLPTTEGTHQDHLALVAYSGADRLPLWLSLEGDTFSRVTLLQPNGGERLLTGSRVAITWGLPLSAFGVDLLYSLDNGSTWKTIDVGVEGTSYDWTVPPVSATRSACLVKVKGRTDSGALLSADRSDRTFTIQPLHVLAPQGGEAFTSGEPLAVSWEQGSTLRPVEPEKGVRVQLTTNGGLTWRTLAELPAGTTAYEGEVPSVSSVRSACRVRVQLRDATGKLVGSDRSDRPITISPQPVP